MNKIAWLISSPRTGIGKYAQVVKSILDDKVEILICEQIPDLDKLTKFSTVVYNLGNSKDNVPLYLTLRKLPGVVILHDRTYHHFFAYYFLNYLKKPELYYKSLEFLYGKNAAHKAKIGLRNNQPIWDGLDSVTYSMRELFYPYATSLIVHSKSYLAEIKKDYDGFSHYLSLPFTMPVILKPSNLTIKISIPADKLILFSYGFISNNRMITEMIDIIAENYDLRSKVYYIIAGEIDERYLNTINEKIDKYRLNGIIKLFNYLSDEDLFFLLRRSDMCINLRKYNTEGVSWSLLEQMSYGKPVLVLDKGFFSEIPDEVVIKVKDLGKIPRELLRFTKSKEELKRIGEKAKEYVAENFDPQIFKTGLLNLLEATKVLRMKEKILKKLLMNTIEMIPPLPLNLAEEFFSKLSSDLSAVFRRPTNRENSY